MEFLLWFMICVYMPCMVVALVLCALGHFFTKKSKVKKSDNRELWF